MVRGGAEEARRGRDTRGLSLMSNDHDQVSTVAITRSHCTVCCAFGRVFSVLLAALEADIWGGANWQAQRNSHRFSMNEQAPAPERNLSKAAVL
ncbi:hypothetical protein BFJ66_g1885 [Fusarium oxysporum f. sp. cepae]|nr:hypothetical protein BFJ66_g1885 [Fusarium oxysporum f. sp. cepae]RKK64071.1 hypothetical protein BFJ67_g713 [Fusarium oxysporum f. sp. cepae]